MGGSRRLMSERERDAIRRAVQDAERERQSQQAETGDRAPANPSDR